ncbi:unnamed protein product [Brassicogethes aeneus]|uniref:Outer dense fiber protein 3 n=1 Tax=Brassicogethes aeneus TaxID=1431903 RepID=A0A9P0AWA1_BRAAE|nr:unnamed protein product [Brassicogethes aeneus]
MNRLMGPGPGNYKLPSLIGRQNHDFTKKCEPAYSMRIKSSLAKRRHSPGPKYDLTGLTVYGRSCSPKYSQKSRPRTLRKIGVPGPGDYKPEDVPPMSSKRAPRYSMMRRTAGVNPKLGSPGPMAYGLPTTIGPKVPDKYANAAYTMKVTWRIKARPISPGPAAYSAISQDVCKHKLPTYSIATKAYPPNQKAYGPGPIYKPKLDEKPGYSFGLKTNAIPFFTLKDQGCTPPKTGKVQKDIC